MPDIIAAATVTTNITGKFPQRLDIIAKLVTLLSRNNRSIARMIIREEFFLIQRGDQLIITMWAVMQEGQQRQPTLVSSLSRSILSHRSRYIFLSIDQSRAPMVILLSLFVK